MYKKCTYCNSFYNDQKDDKICIQCKEEYVVIKEQLENHKKTQLNGV